MVKYSGVSIIRSTRRATGEKRYIPHINGQALRLSWNTATRAEAYANRVYERCVRIKLARVTKEKL